ncbi:RodZ domain-containing protein [Alkalimonas sp. NCh-2]|uniref:RodZ domain-containing protein n=1 Tax=Alkalimonas sp. NCh-2 TaxID=3144846 RepID=UPI0031F654A2
MTTESTSTEVQQVRAGELLRLARERKQWSVKEAASQLNLKLSLIESMERDQYDANLLPTFIRGYLRSYARLLKISEQDVLSAYERHHGGQQAETRAMHSFSNRTEKEATENRFMLLTYLVGAVLIGLLLLWWWQTHWLSDEVTANTSSVSTAAQLSELTFSEADTGPEQGEYQESMLDTGPEDDEVFAPESSSEVPAEASMMATQPVAETVLSSNQLTMRFADDCWIDVVDDNGSRVAFGTKRAGYLMQVQGKAPFTVTLGNPTVVEIELDHEPVDLSGFASGRVAKFSVPIQE